MLYHVSSALSHRIRCEWTVQSARKRIWRIVLHCAALRCWVSWVHWVRVVQHHITSQVMELPLVSFNLLWKRQGQTTESCRLPLWSQICRSWCFISLEPITAPSRCDLTGESDSCHFRGGSEALARTAAPQFEKAWCHPVLGEPMIPAHPPLSDDRCVQRYRRRFFSTLGVQLDHIQSSWLCLLCLVIV